MTKPRESSASASAACPEVTPLAVDGAFRGVCAFLLTPMRNGGDAGPAVESSVGAGSGTARASSPMPVGARIDETAFVRLVERAAAAGVASIGVLGSTGSYMFLSGAERARVFELAVRHAAGVPVLAGIGSISTYEVIENVRAAEAAGAAGLILAPVSYQRLSDDEVFGLFQDVAAVATAPIVVYDNPSTTGFTFSLEMYARVAALPGIASIKIPPPGAGIAAAREHVSAMRAVIPEHVTIGVSGDASARLGLSAGCDGWYSVIAGVLPEAALQLARAAAGSVALAPVLDLFDDYGSLRVAAAVAEELGLVGEDSLPRPVRGLDDEGQARVRAAMTAAGL